jgi:hypothetical protein
MRIVQLIFTTTAFYFAVAIILFFFLVVHVRENSCGAPVEVERIRTSSGYEFVVREEGLCDWAGIYVSKTGERGQALISEIQDLRGATQIVETGPHSVRVIVSAVGFSRRLDQWNELKIEFDTKNSGSP